MNSHYGPGYDPLTGQNFRYGDSTYLGQSNRHSRAGGNPDFLNDPQQYFMQRGINYGMGMVNSAAEGLFFGVMESPYGGAKARFNFQLDLDGRINGEGDVLLPFYDSAYTTVFTQLGARSMSGMSGGGSDGRSADRWIGNFGLGQRWYPMAVNEGTGQDAGNLMLGYNVFFDNDFTRSHQRGGVGIEAQYDWIHLASNYYAPLSGWKGSKDFDRNFVKERAAEGWDIRAKGYLPFYRNVALTGAYTQWKGDHVGMYSSRDLEKDPKVWSYGVEYTPIPLVSGFVNQRSTERGRSDTEFGLRMTYTFNMPWDQQTSHAKVAEMRTVGGSRHEFVDRENRIILEYKAKNNFHIEYLGKVGTNQFKFRIRNGFDQYVAGQVITVRAGGGVTLAEVKAPAPTTFLAQAGEFISDLFSVSTAHAADFSQTYTTDRNGEFIVKVDNVTTTPVVLTIQAGNSNQSVTLREATVTSVVTLTRTDAQVLPVGTVVNNVSFTLADTVSPASVQNKTVTLAWSGTGTFDTPPTTASTDGSGNFTLNLKGQTAGTSTLTVTLPDGRKATYDLTVAASALTITRTDTQALSVGLLVNNVTFALADTNTPASVQSKSITLAWSGTGTFDTLPTTASTNGSGNFTLNLKGQTAGTSTLTVTLPDGRSIPVNLTVAAATYTLSQTPTTTIAVGQTVSTMPFTLTANSSPVPDGTSVTLSYSTSHGAFTTSGGTATVGSGNGSFNLNLEGQTAGAVTVTATWGGTKTAYCTVTVANPTYSIAFDSSTPTFNFSGSGANNKASGSVTVTVRNTSAGNTPVSGAPVSLSATMATSNQAVVAARKTQFYGLKVDVNSGGLQDGGASFPVASGTTDSNGKVTLNLEDVVGERTLTLIASVTPLDGSAVNDTATVAFGDGPLAAFKAPDGTTKEWTSSGVYDVAGATQFNAADYCNGSVTVGTPAFYNNVSWEPIDSAYYAKNSKLPTQAQLQAVSNNGAWSAAGWPDNYYWTGEIIFDGRSAFIVYETSLAGLELVYDHVTQVVCLR